MLLLIARRMAVPSALLACVAPLAGCGGNDDVTDAPAASTTTTTPTVQLDTTKVAKAIKASIKEQRDIRAKVTCPDTVLQAKGRNFVCTATTKDGTTNFAVTQTDDSGNVTYAAAE